MSIFSHAECKAIAIKTITQIMPTIPKYDYVIIKLLAMGTTVDKPEMQSELKQWLFETENFLKKQSTKFLKPIKVNV